LVLVAGPGKRGQGRLRLGFVPLCVDGRNLHLSLEQASGTRSDCRFLTQLQNAAVILPAAL
jgi:hypothetical protein